MDTPKELNEIVLPQTVIGPLTRAAIFLVVCIRAEQDNYATLRSNPSKATSTNGWECCSSNDTFRLAAISSFVVTAFALRTFAVILNR